MGRGRGRRHAVAHRAPAVGAGAGRRFGDINITVNASGNADGIADAVRAAVLDVLTDTLDRAAVTA